MLGKLIAKLTVFALRSKNLSLEQRILCTSALLDNLHAVPLRNTITFDDQGTLFINGKALDYEKARQLRESAKGMLESQAREFVRQQVKFKAIEIGVHNGLTNEQILFSKAALWFGIEEDNLYHALAGYGDSTETHGVEF